jgi:hypothetical protein
MLLKVVGTLFVLFGLGAIVSISQNSDAWFGRFMGAYIGLFACSILYLIWVVI